MKTRERAERASGGGGAAGDRCADRLDRRAQGERARRAASSPRAGLASSARAQASRPRRESGAACAIQSATSPGVAQMVLMRVGAAARIPYWRSRARERRRRGAANPRARAAAGGITVIRRFTS